MTAPQGDTRGHGQAHEPLAAKPDRHLVACHARPRADEPHGCGNDRGRDPRASLTGSARHVGEEGDRPAAQRVHLPGVRAVRDGIGHGRAVPQHGAKVEQRCAGWRVAASSLGGRAQEDDQPGDHRGGGRSGEGAAPAEPAAQEAGEQERQRSGDADARRVAGDGARHERGVHAIGQELETGHVGPGPAHAGENARHPGAPRPVGERREPDVARHREADARQVDGTRVDPVGEGHEERDGHGVRGVEEPRDPARLPVGDVPVGDERWQERGPGVRADLGADLGDAHEGHEPGRRHPARVPGRAGQHQPAGRYECSRLQAGVEAAPGLAKGPARWLTQPA